MTARIGAPKTGGRRKGSLDKGERQLVSAELGYSILATFEMLGGTAAMLEWAAENKTVFYTQILSHLMPPPQRDEGAEVVNNTQINVNNLSDREAAVRVAFALSKAVYDSEPAPAIEHEPVFAPNAWQPPTDAPSMPDPRLAPKEPEPLDEDHQRWINELPLTDEQRRDNAICRETRACTLETYPGGAGEQPGTEVRRPTSTRKPSAGELCRRLSRRGELL
jgi:hypothetical protein